MANTNGAGAQQLDDNGPDGAFIAGAFEFTSDEDVVGYGTGAGGTVTQATSITTGVTLSKPCGTITTVSSTLVAGADATFTVTNTLVAATDVIVANVKSYGGTADGIPVVNVTAVAAGSFDLNIRNTGAVTLDDTVVISFAVVKAVAA